MLKDKNTFEAKFGIFFKIFGFWDRQWTLKTSVRDGTFSVAYFHQ